MRFICYVSDLKDAAKLVAKCADAKPQTPILAAVKISAENDQITFDATNFKVTAQINLPANIEETGSICVNAKLFAEIVNKAAEDVIRLETVDNKLKIESGASKFELLTYSSDEFPTTNFDTDFNVKVRAAILKKLIRRTVFAVTRDNDRPIFKGVNFIFGDDELTAVATNAQRIAIDKMHAETFGYDAFSAVVPADALKTLADALSDDIEDLVTVTGTFGSLTFSFDNVKFKARLIEGEFPDWNKALEIEPSLEVVFGTKELRYVLNRVNIISRDAEYNCVVFDFADGYVKIGANSDTLGGVTEVIQASPFDGELKIAFNTNFLIDLLGAVDTDHLRFKLAGKVDPAVIVDDDSDFVYVVTPVRI